MAVTLGGVGVVLLDIEGTTTPIAFVHDVLFPYARAGLGDLIAEAAEREDVAGAVRLLSDERAAEPGDGDPPSWPTGDPTAQAARAGVVAYAHWLMDRDRKSPALKRLQGLIWERGYQAGELRGDLYPDVPPALGRWRAAGLGVAIYSSGSELAQRRLFESAPGGDLTPLIDRFFDTRVGAKVEVASYTRIAAALELPAGRVCFVSDVIAELDAAAAAGLRAVLSVRPGNRPQPFHAYPVVHTFDDLVATSGPARA